MDQSSRILGSPNLIYILFLKIRAQPPLKKRQKNNFYRKLKKKYLGGGSRVFLGVKLIPP
jgi:hypothetical protein